jgi:hypothetical protein
MSEFVSEEQCMLCSGMWPSEQELFRAHLESIPAREPICDVCLMAFWRNIGFPVRDDGPTEH